jgi:TonB-dependent receptor
VLGVAVHARGYKRLVAAVSGALIASPGGAAAQPVGADSEPGLAAASDEQPDTPILVTGLRSTLLEALERRRRSPELIETLALEDIARTSGANIAETLDRLPGVRLGRDITGEGVQLSIRGLGSEFARVLLNGAPLQVASDGGTNGGSRGRGVDLDILPSEFFARGDVLLAASAGMPEGGINGTLDLRTLRPSDRPGLTITLSGQAQYSAANRKTSPRGTAIASWAGRRIGVLAGVSVLEASQRLDGFETIGWTDANVPACGPDCRLPGDSGNGFSYASVVPANAGHGLRPGDPVDLVAASGLALPQISAALLPRLARQLALSGKRRRTAAMASLEWQPADRVHLVLDGLYAHAARRYERLGMQWYVRNSGPGKTPQSTGGMVPIGLTVDANNVVTSGLFANSAFLAEETLTDQDTRFHALGGALSWQAAKHLRIEAQARLNRSNFRREQPTFLFQTPMQSGIDVRFDNRSNPRQPVITTNRDLGDPGLGWQWSRLNIQNIARETQTDSARLDMVLGGEGLNLKIGGAYDLARRRIRSFDNSQAYQLAVCGVNCAGKEGSVPNAALEGFLRRAPISDFGRLAKRPVGYTSFIAPDFAALKQATGYQAFSAAAPLATTQVGGNPPGDIGERVLAAYGEANGRFTVRGRDLTFNLGLRRVDTRQDVTGVALLDAKVVEIPAQRRYGNWLPSANIRAALTRRLTLRFAFARTLTRPDPALLLPSTVFTDSSAQIAAAGNPGLRPYTSSNFDLGLEWATGGIGSVRLAAFSRSIDGFTVVQSEQVAFASLGIPFAALSSTQQNVLSDRSFQTGVPVAQLPVSLTRPVNLESLLIRGLDFALTQPLDRLLAGAGLTVTASWLDQRSASGLVAPGVPRWSASGELFYERGPVSASVRYDWTGRFIAANGPLNGLDLAQYADPRGQLDLSLVYRVPNSGGRFQFTASAINITNAPLRTTLGYGNAAFAVYYPGPQYMLGFGARY